MSKQEAELINKLKRIFSRYLEDQEHAHPRFKVSALSGEIHGNLADLLYIDKVENDLLVGFIIGLLYAREGADDKEQLAILKDIYSALNSFDEGQLAAYQRETPVRDDPEANKQKRIAKYYDDLRMARENGWERPEKPSDLD